MGVDVPESNVGSGSSNVAMQGRQAAYAILGARDFGAALVGGAASMFVMGSGGQQAVQFGAVCALSSSLADAVLTIGGLETQIAYYDPNYPLYFDLADAVVGAGVGAAFFWYLGASGTELMYSAAICGMSASVGPKLSTALLTQTAI